MGEEVTLIVRPEMIQIGDARKVKGIVQRSSYLGDAIDYDVDVNGQLLTAVETDPTRMVVHTVGNLVALDFHEDCIHVLP